ncbi:hypothetical protein POM88_028339 [Heracleum sosnowskyi]|uniref:Uncharacterized protein n=1 Tax=Heracleum sosnowskyi TaxID=360622 RepID=A0AAD8ICT3_9APIA|nr:hypothetical protein POM88_028339 [Heracleum sosnowskyi]
MQGRSYEFLELALAYVTQGSRTDLVTVIFKATQRDDLSITSFRAQTYAPGRLLSNHNLDIKVVPLHSESDISSDSGFEAPLVRRTGKNNDTDQPTQDEEPVVTQTTQEPVVTLGEDHVVPQRKTAKEAKKHKIQVRRPVKNVGKQVAPAIPRKKIPFVKDNDPRGKVACLTGKDSEQLEERLRGEFGYQACFMPTPGLSSFKPPRTSPVTDNRRRK